MGKIGLLLIAATLSWATHATQDIFDPEYCSGTPMSPQRAIELLKGETEVDLTPKTMEPEGVTARARRRNVIGGVLGDWYEVSNARLPVVRPILFNDSGSIGLKFKVYSVTTTDRQKTYNFLYYVTCKKINAGYSCEEPIGKATFVTKLNDTCFHMAFDGGSETSEYQEVYYSWIY